MVAAFRARKVNIMAEKEESSTEETGTLESLNISDVFNDSKTDAKADESAEGKAEDEKGEQSGEKADDKTKAESPSAEETGLKAALAAERRRRQEAEGKLREKDAVKAKAPDPIEDPEGYASHLRAENGRNEFKTKIALSRDLMIDTREDFIEKEKVFMGLVADEAGNITDESLFRKFQNAPNPARFAYNHAKEHLEVQELKSPEYREKLKAEIRAELEAERKEKKPKSATEVPDLTKATAAASNSTAVEELTELSDMFRDSKL